MENGFKKEEIIPICTHRSKVLCPTFVCVFFLPSAQQTPSRQQSIKYHVPTTFCFRTNDWFLCIFKHRNLDAICPVCLHHPMLHHCQNRQGTHVYLHCNDILRRHAAHHCRDENYRESHRCTHPKQHTISIAPPFNSSSRTFFRADPQQTIKHIQRGRH